MDRPRKQRRVYTGFRDLPPAPVVERPNTGYSTGARLDTIPEADPDAIVFKFFRARVYLQI